MVPCGGLFLRGGFAGENKIILEAAMQGDEEPCRLSGPVVYGIWKGKVSPVKVTVGEAVTSG